MRNAPRVVLSLGLALAAMEPLAASATPAVASAARSEVYVVRPGDTLWGIAAHFLKNPWDWPLLWRRNPAIRNPNLIYPGDRIVLSYDAAGQPHLQVIQLQPKMQVGPIPSYNTGVMMPFLGSPGLIASRSDYERLPYIAAADDSDTIFSNGDRLYVKQLGDLAPGTMLRVVRAGPTLTRPGETKSLGHALMDLGSAKVLRAGSLAEIEITNAREEISLGDRLVPEEPEPSPHFFPSSPTHPVQGHIIGSLSNFPEMMVGQVVVVDRGSAAGLVPGNVLQIDGPENASRDAVTGERLTLPGRDIGSLMLFRVFPEVSFAVVTVAKRGIQVGDALRNPPPTAPKVLGIAP
ncbi:MAG: LysM peptidoglycan-binding domain-containing protein [Acidithiobacillus sp.]|uniref:LysM peptidoglycan-binding domain-containing protein n=1 Tax=Acidithiobacillus sp. TaxID=1872118 RepID=UPI003D0515D8